MAKLIDFHRVRGEWYKFKLKAIDSDDFRSALASLKYNIALQDRNWLEDEKYWEVRATASNEEVLASIFSNGHSSIEMLKRQLTLF